MRNRIRTGLIVLLSVLGAIAPASAEEATLLPIDNDEALRRAAAAPPESALPGHDAYVLFEGVFATYRDGKAEVRRQRLTRLYNEWAMDELGDPRISHDATRQELVIHASRTYLAGGETVDTPENGFNEVTPDGLDRSVDHLGLRETVVTHTGLVPGAVVFLDWTVRDTIATPAPFDMVCFPNGRFGAAEAVVVAEGLRGETVSPETALHELPEPRKEAGKLVWHMKNLGPGPLAGPGRAGDELPWIALSSADSWEKGIEFAARSIEAASAAHAGLDETLADLEKEAPFLSDRDLLGRCVQAAGDKTALVDHEAWRHFRTPRTVEKALARSFATPMERCALLLACCREKDIEALIVFPARWKSITEHVPALECLGNPGLRAVGGDGSTWWIDPAEGVVAALPGFGAGFEYFVYDGRTVSREKTPAETSRVEIAFHWDLVEGSAKCEGRIVGPAARGLAGGDPGGLIEEWMGGWSDSAEAGDVNVQEAGPTRLVFSGSAKAPLAAPDDRGRTVVPLPVAPVSIADLLPHVASTVHRSISRVLFSESPVEVSLKWRLRTPERRDALPGASIDKECPGGSLLIQWNGQGDEIEIAYTLVWDGRAVKPEAYPEFRAFLVEAIDERNVRLVLGSEKEKAKDES